MGDSRRFSLTNGAGILYNISAKNMEKGVACVLGRGGARQHGGVGLPGHVEKARLFLCVKLPVNAGSCLHAGKVSLIF